MDSISTPRVGPFKNVQDLLHDLHARTGEHYLVPTHVERAARAVRALGGAARPRADPAPSIALALALGPAPRPASVIHIVVPSPEAPRSASATAAFADRASRRTLAALPPKKGSLTLMCLCVVSTLR